MNKTMLIFTVGVFGVILGSLGVFADPESKWAKKAMETVDGRTTTKPTTCFTSTTNMISTTTNTTPTPETETSTSTTEPPKVTRIDTLQLKTEISESTTEDHPDCCLTVTNTRTDEDIVDYHIQDSSLCPIRATETSTREIKSISTTANQATSVVEGKSSFTVITVQTTTDPENSRTVSEVDMRLTTAAQIIDTTPPLTTFKELELDVAASTEDCCLTVTENRAAIHEIEETPAEDWDYIQNLNRRTTEQTDKREFIRKTKALELDRRRSTETTDTLQLDGLSEESSLSERNDPYTNNEYFCVKKEPVQYFCIKQP
ncbi:hypothetical protein DPX16_2761 [Anabarilius grahami]|uniref:Uncharacterized protein n=1 Tax=Anabarilius grahami TaxID=495550 RepID=A0A3N0XT79_ANAGA|nr:hypothetical protein DPX16_2761 [Anabarilius grahami]